jgi:hypothetical protein
MCTCIRLCTSRKLWGRLGRLWRSRSCHRSWWSASSTSHRQPSESRPSRAARAPCLATPRCADARTHACCPRILCANVTEQTFSCKFSTGLYGNKEEKFALLPSMSVKKLLFKRLSLIRWVLMYRGLTNSRVRIFLAGDPVRRVQPGLHKAPYRRRRRDAAAVGRADRGPPRPCICLDHAQLTCVRAKCLSSWYGLRCDCSPGAAITRHLAAARLNDQL